jgi:serine/threonine-protein kinase RsbW
MDRVHFVNRGWKGKELQLTKYLKVPHVETYFSGEEMRPYEATDELAPQGEVEYRLMEPKDAVGVARCIYKTYGYTYPSEHVYFPDRVAAMIRHGELIGAVGVTETGEVIGHSALLGRPGDPLMEACEAVVAPAYRGHGVLNRTMDLLLAEARRRGLAGLYAEAITLHPFSQRTIIKHGFRESAVLLSRFPRHIRVAGFTGEELPQRETILYLYMPLTVEPRGVGFAPAHHRPMLERIYNNLGLTREFAAADSAGKKLGFDRAPQGIPHFSLTAQAVSALDIGTIEVMEYGPGIEQEVQDKLRDLCRKGIATVYLHLPLGDPQTAVLCRRFEEFGFFFSGILPRPGEPAGQERMPTRDLLCLQYLNGSAVDYDRLQIYSDFGRELMGYVRAQDPLG